MTKSPKKTVAPLPNLKFRCHSKNTLNYSDDIEVLKAIEGFISALKSYNLQQFEKANSNFTCEHYGHK